MKEKDKYIGNGRMLMMILDQMLTQKEGRISRSRSLCEELLDNATFTLARIQWTCRLAVLEYQSGAGRSGNGTCSLCPSTTAAVPSMSSVHGNLYKKCCATTTSLKKNSSRQIWPQVCTIRTRKTDSDASSLGGKKGVCRWKENKLDLEANPCRN